MRQGMERNEIWLPFGFDHKIFERALKARFRNSKINCVVPKVECKDNQTNIQYDVMLSDAPDVPGFLEEFAYEHGFKLNDELSSFCWIMADALSETVH